MIEVVFSSQGKLAGLLKFRGSFKRSSLFTRKRYGSSTEDKDKAPYAKVNKSGHVKKLTVPTNDRIQAGFNSVRRKKAENWTQNQFTDRMPDYQKNTNLFGNVQNDLFLLRLTDDLFLL